MGRTQQHDFQWNTPVSILVPEPLDRLRPGGDLLDLIQHENRPTLARFGGLDAGNLPLLLDPIPASQRGLVGAGEAGSKVVPVNHVPHESGLSDLTRASDRLDEAACPPGVTGRPPNSRYSITIQLVTPAQLRH